MLQPAGIPYHMRSDPLVTLRSRIVRELCVEALPAFTDHGNTDQCSVLMKTGEFTVVE